MLHLSQSFRLEWQYRQKRERGENVEEFLRTFVFILPGITAYFWIQAFGLTPSSRHTASEVTGIAALLWLPVSFFTLLVLNIWGVLVKIDILSVNQVWSMAELSQATSDIRYLALFLFVSFGISFLLCWVWSLWLYKFLKSGINKVRKAREIAPLSPSATVWEEFFVKIDSGGKKEDSVEKEAVYVVYQIDKPHEFVAGSMLNASSPLEDGKALVLSDTQRWVNAIKNEYDYKVKRSYVDMKSGMVVEEIDHKNPKDKTIPEDND